MELADLKTFETVARHGSMNRAAAELNTVQSNVTARIRALEHELGVALFRRHARGVSTTPAGQRMLPLVGRVAKLMADVKMAARDDGEPAGSLELGALETTMALRLAPVLAGFARAHPQVRLAVHGGTSAALIDDVLAGRLDGAFVAGPADHPDLLAEPVFSEELVLVTSPAVASPQALARRPDLRTIVFRSGCSYRQRLDTLLASLGIVAARPLEFGSLDAILACVAADVGITLLPRAVAALAADNGDVILHPLAPGLADVETLFVRRRDAYVSSALTVFLARARAAHALPEKQKAPEGALVVG
ncbi:LysR family transcriptional regulator [Massilia luteola]|uniref:LysR family transcriptional regulator n=1 Tax=Massilia luteola TaxID=3081751 RepID=UPI002ACC3240|nr:LysR family transcriptional regulator [Massilia sp. Gc5]